MSLTNCPITPFQSLEISSLDVNQKVRWEVFIDLNCPDSAAAWPIVKDVQAYYGNNQLDLVFQQLTVSYHKHSLISTQVSNCKCVVFFRVFWFNIIHQINFTVQINV